MHTLGLFREIPGSITPRGETVSEQAPELEQANKNAAHVVCAACAGVVTCVDDKLCIQGRHSHRFMNPEGQRFEIACYGRAPGVLGVGESSSVWTWFPGYVWQAVVCRACVRHLGWCYRRESETFFGLITDRLIELTD